MARIWIILCLLACIPVTIQAQSRGNAAPSSSLKTLFFDHFSDADEVVWKPSKDGYDVTFQQKGLKMVAHYSFTEAWEYTNVAIPLKLVPRTSVNHLKSRYGAAPIIKTEYHDASDGSYYRIVINLNGSYRELHYDDKGNFLRIK